MSVASELAASELKRRATAQKTLEECRYREQRLVQTVRAAWDRIVRGLQEGVEEYNKAFAEAAAAMFPQPPQESFELHIVKFGGLERTTRIHLNSSAEPPLIEFGVARGKANRPS